MDCTFKTSEGNFNYRVGTFIKDEGKGGKGRILVVRNPAEAEGVYYSVGGRVQFGESLEQAVLRELNEETGIEFSPDDVWLCAIHENFFTASNGIPFHEFSAFFQVKVTDQLLKIQSGHLTKGGPSGEFLQWIDLDDLEGKTIFPVFFLDEAFGKDKSVAHYVTKDGVCKKV